MLIGKVVRLNYNIKSTGRGKFARLAVGIDLTKLLISIFILD